MTSPGGAERSVGDKNKHPVKELTPAPPPPVTMINSYSDKICSYFSRLVGPMMIPVISVTIERRRCTCGCDKPSVSKCSGKLAGESVDRAPEKGVASKKPPANGPQGGGNHLLVQVGGGGGGILPVKESADYGRPPAKVVSGSGEPPAKVVSGSGKPPAKVVSGSGKPPEKGGNPLLKGGGSGVARPRPLRHLAVLLAVFSCLCAAVAADTSQPEEKSKFNCKMLREDG